ncbi:hypothetical protein ES705_11096 [subsurface metagenome]
MKIEKIRIQNFQCINGPEEVEINDNVMCLIGKNERGKTTFLRALKSFNLDHKYAEDDISSYSDIKGKLDSGEIEPKDIVMITIWFETTGDDKEKLNEIHEASSKIKHLKVTKYFDNQYTVESTELDLEEIKKQTIESIQKEIKTEIDNLSKKISVHMQRNTPFANNKVPYDQYVEEFILIDLIGLPEGELNKKFDVFYNNLRGLTDKDPPIDEDIKSTVESLGKIKDRLIESLKENNTEGRILKLIPSFIYFDDIDILKQDTVNIDNFLSNKLNYKTFDNLLKLVGLNAEELKVKTPSRQRIETKRASRKITGEINEFWKQGEYDVEVTYNTPNFVILIEDETKTEQTPPSKRSKGFQWFLSFYINFMEGSKSEFKNTILLLDDPGVYLHAEGQKNLLDTLEKLKENNQIIYATHSPFLIDKNHLDRIKILEKGDKGTVIKKKFYESESDALAPIRASIGATIGDSLFTNKKNIIVEGFSDYLILEAVSNYFKRNKKEFLDFSKIAIIPVGGADKFPYFTLLLEKENFRFIDVLDYDSQGIKVAKELKENYNIKKNMVIMLNECVSDKMKGGGRGRDIEIEDLIDENFYNKVVNRAYSEVVKKDINMDELNTDTTKHTKKYVEFFKNNKLGGFDKVLVARQIGKITLDSSLKYDDLGTLTTENFERLFKIINERLT